MYSLHFNKNKQTELNAICLRCLDEEVLRTRSDRNYKTNINNLDISASLFMLFQNKKNY